MTVSQRGRARRAMGAFSLLFFPATFYYFSPIISLMGAAQGVIAGSLVVFALLFLSSLFLGRSFCSWVCPAGGAQDLLLPCQGRPSSARRLGWLKFALWGVWLASLLVLFRGAAGVRAVSLGFATTGGFSVGDVSSLVTYLIVVLSFFALSLFFGKRAACHTVCWMAPFMVLGTGLSRALRFPRRTLLFRAEKCSACGACASACPMSVQPASEAKGGSVGSRDCVLCGACEERCPGRALEIGWRR